MKRALWILAAGLISAGLAQGVRSLGMGGVALPGPAHAGINPAYAAFPDTWSKEGVGVPLGLLRLLPLFPDTSLFAYLTDSGAFKANFDLLSLYDQATYPDSFLLNPARSPDEVVFRVSANGLSLTDGSGRSLVPSFQAGASPAKPQALIPSPLLDLSFSLGPGTYLSFGPFLGS